LARSTLFKPKWWGVVLKHLNAHPIEREGGDVRAFQLGLRLVAVGDKIIFFPEGTRSPDGSLQPFKGGVARMVSRAKVPVIPVYIAGAYDIWPRDRKYPRLRGHIACVLGSPLYWEQFEHLERREAYEAFTQRLFQAVHDLRSWYEAGAIGNPP
jgi:1-acyl-sn-glycerol-3-phosphate acyltransferase